eukprot:CAMPEP_0197010318 /NCGR_PEP_ID=MMETSP1380-20130617/53772_1 /TAXON_ID=5936 /ORGANISM="Euplotes crassus, Strain CT5" /LENGTH=101 /DNA_ID=CAMNT_0042432165 /DNA_START=49 /DNA_END=354 /DNA_ORIENTATION=-
MGRKHIPEQQFRRCTQDEWKPSRVIQKDPGHWMEKHTSKIIERFTIVKPKSERMTTIDNMTLKLKEKKYKQKQETLQEEERIVRELDDWEENHLVQQIEKQ